MLLCCAQIKPVKGDVPANIKKHTALITVAASRQVDFILFPELSLTGYEPELAHELATTPEDKRFHIFSELSKLHRMTIAVGMPIRQDRGIVIGMLVFEPGKAVQLYAKQLLHQDEEAFFTAGNSPLIFEVKSKKIAPAICFESFHNRHAEQAYSFKAEIYAASVAKSAAGLEKAHCHYPEIAAKHSFFVMMANSTGFCDNFESRGQSAVWDRNGKQLGQLLPDVEGLLICNAQSKEVERINY